MFGLIILSGCLFMIFKTQSVTFRQHEYKVGYVTLCDKNCIPDPVPPKVSSDSSAVQNEQSSQDLAVVDGSESSDPDPKSVPAQQLMTRTIAIKLEGYTEIPLLGKFLTGLKIEGNNPEKFTLTHMVKLTGVNFTVIAAKDNILQYLAICYIVGNGLSIHEILVTEQGPFPIKVDYSHSKENTSTSALVAFSGMQIVNGRASITEMDVQQTHVSFKLEGDAPFSIPITVLFFNSILNNEEDVARQMVMQIFRGPQQAGELSDSADVFPIMGTTLLGITSYNDNQQPIDFNLSLTFHQTDNNTIISTKSSTIVSYVAFAFYVYECSYQNCYCNATAYSNSESVSFQCEDCHNLCKSCYQRTQYGCLSCDTLKYKYLQNHQCITESETLSCSSKCLSCLPGNSSCQTCTSLSWKTHRQLPGDCNCYPFYFNKDKDQVCADCHYTCYECEDKQETSCKGCGPQNDYHRHLAEEYTCLCDSHYFDNGKSVCQVCHYSCKTCETSGDHCLDCEDSSTHFREFDQSKFSCPCISDLYFNNGEPACKKCIFPCITCSSADDCLTCPPSSEKFELSEARCKCIVGYAYVTTSQSCELCSIYCHACTGILETQCSSCLTLQSRHLEGTTCVCNIGMYDDKLGAEGAQRACQLCSLTCKTCIEKSTCETCDADKHRQFHQKQCICMDGYYGHPSFNCLECHSSCQTCQGPKKFDCKSCDSSRFRSMVLKECPCIQEYYDDDTLQCQECFTNCLTCKGPNETDCVLCDRQTNHREEVAGRCSCEDGYFEKGDKICGTCHYSCATCSQTPACLTCESPRVLKSGVCECKDPYYDDRGQCICRSGYYEEIDEQTKLKSCQQCHISCVECSGPSKNQCLSCGVSSVTYKEGKNICTCVLNYFNPDGKVCEECSEDCSQCFGRFPNQCTLCRSHTREIDKQTNSCVCKSGYLLQENSCSKCHYSCEYCFKSTQAGQDSCITCPPGSDRQLRASRCDCKDYYYEAEKGTCQACFFSCLLCGGPEQNNCLQCNPKDLRFLVESQCICHDGTFEVPGQAKCQGCHYQCGTCLGPKEIDCFQCLPATKRQLIDKRCDCAAQFYDENQKSTCRECHYTCKSCTGPSLTECNGCGDESVTNRYMNTATRLCQCLQGYFENTKVIDQKCHQCHPTCHECVGSDLFSCTSCDTKHQRVLVYGVCKCKQDYYSPRPEIPHCLECYQQCIVCILEIQNTDNILKCHCEPRCSESFRLGIRIANKYKEVEEKNPFLVMILKIGKPLGFINLLLKTPQFVLVKFFIEIKLTELEFQVYRLLSHFVFPTEISPFKQNATLTELHQFSIVNMTDIGHPFDVRVRLRLLGFHQYFIYTVSSLLVTITSLILLNLFLKYKQRRSKSVAHQERYKKILRFNRWWTFIMIEGGHLVIFTSILINLTFISELERFKDYTFLLSLAATLLFLTMYISQLCKTTLQIWRQVSNYQHPIDETMEGNIRTALAHRHNFFIQIVRLNRLSSALYTVGCQIKKLLINILIVFLPFSPLTQLCLILTIQLTQIVYATLYFPYRFRLIGYLDMAVLCSFVSYLCISINDYSVQIWENRARTGIDIVVSLLIIFVLDFLKFIEKQRIFFKDLCKLSKQKNSESNINSDQTREVENVTQHQQVKQIQSPLPQIIIQPPEERKVKPQKQTKKRDVLSVFHQQAQVLQYRQGPAGKISQNNDLETQAYELSQFIENNQYRLDNITYYS